MLKHAIVLFGLVVLGACATRPSAVRERPSAEALGLKPETAIEVCDPAGQQAYLSRLACPNGGRPEFVREGSFGERHPVPESMSEEEQMELMTASLERRELSPGEVDYHIVDGYSVTCGGESTLLYLDMYHCAHAPPDVAPPGFDLVE